MEYSFSKYLNLKHGIGVNSGTDAIQIALMSAKVGMGDEVITVPNTAVPTVSAIVSCGAKPVFVDIKEDDYLIDIKKIITKIKPYSLHDRIVKLELRPDRADVIVHAGKIYSKCMEWSGAKKMIVPQAGLPDGIISQLYFDFRN